MEVSGLTKDLASQESVIHRWMDSYHGQIFSVWFLLYIQYATKKPAQPCNLMFGHHHGLPTF